MFACLATGLLQHNHVAILTVRTSNDRGASFFLSFFAIIHFMVTTTLAVRVPVAAHGVVGGGSGA